MRIHLVMTALVLLAGCGLGDESPRAVDPATLGPLSGREQALLVGAEGALRAGNLEAAERDYQSAVAASTGHVEAHLALAALYERQRQSEKERAILERAQALQPNHPRVNYLLGKRALAAGDEEAALAAFRRGLLTAANDIDLMTASGIAHDMAGRHDAAQAVYQRAITQHPGANLAGVRTNLGMSYLLSNEPKKAVATLRDEAKKPAASPVTRHNLALAYGLLGRHSEAKKLVHGEMDEETRNLALARLKEYIGSHRRDSNPLAVHEATPAAPAP